MTSRILRISSLATLAALAACKTVANEGRERTPSTAGSASVPTEAGPAHVAAGPDAGPAPTDTPLPWGTRPPTTGTLFPVVDGMCIHGEIWPLATGGALYTYGNGNGPWTRGSETTYACLVDDGLDTGGAVDVAAPGPKQELQDPFRALAPTAVVGSWPGPLVVYGNEQGNGRMREHPSIWSHGDAGWTPIVSWRDARNPEIGAPVVHRGNAITWLRFYKDSSNDDLEETPTFKAVPVEKGAAPLSLAGLATAGLSVDTLATDDTSL